MNKFLTKSQPLTPKRKNGESLGEVSKSSENPKRKEKDEEREPSIMEKLHKAIREDNAQFVFNVLTKNRPFDQAMNKTMTKIDFSSSFSDPTSEFLLVSVDESVVFSFQEGQNLTIRGESTDEAVLCTENSTFPIKIVESATTVMLLEECLEAPDSPTIPGFERKKTSGRCYLSGELCPAEDALNIGRLKDMLRENELRWDWRNREDEELKKGYRLKDLMESIQMSIGETKIAISDLPVIKFPRGNYRFLSHKFRGEMMGLMVELLDDDDILDITFDKLSFSSLRSHLPENVPDEAIHWFLSKKCEKIEDPGDLFKLSKVTLIRDLTVVILYGTQKMPLTQFHELLTKILPFGIDVSDDMFEGIAEISDAPFGKVISYLAPEDLPDTVRERMLYLFQHRKFWTLDQLRPYFSDIYKQKVAFDKYVVQNCDYSLGDTNQMLYCGVRF